ncbi:hypothetical protein B566_EDAN006098 [Ephemera danica]|nr:hypothetical protein B566_EDAN006098 [Ephemera danica]
MMKILTCVVLLLVPSSILGQGSEPQGEFHPPSPCPRVFSYENDRTWNTRWYGTAVFSVPGDRPFNLTITLDRKADLLGAWAGTVISEDNENFILLHPAPENVEGPTRISVRFFVNFPRGGPVPRVVVIRRDRYTFRATTSITDSSENNYSSSELIRPTRPPTRPPNSVSRPSVASVASVTRRPERPTAIPNLSRPNTRPVAFGPSTTPNPWVVTTASTTHTTTTRATTESVHTHLSFAGPTNTVSTSEECGMIDVRSVPFLVNAQSSTYHGEWPWHVAIYSTASGNQKYICGGTLISRRAIITAGHCVTNPTNGRKVEADHLVVYLGKHSLPSGWTISDGVQTFTPDRIIRHPSYDRTNTTGDIAMILLQQDAEITSYVRLICLWPQQETDIRSLEGQLGTVVGWGFDSTNKPSSDMTRVNLQVRSYEECVRSNRDFFSRFLVDKTYCAGWRNGTSACNGDSGGGMVFRRNNRWFLRGVVSNGVPLPDNISLCNPEHYTVFVDVAQYRDWIEHNQPENVNQVSRPSSSVPNRTRLKK